MSGLSSVGGSALAASVLSNSQEAPTGGQSSVPGEGADAPSRMGNLSDDLVGAIASRLPSHRDLVNMSYASQGLRRAARPLLQQVRGLVDQARQVGLSAQPMVDTDRILGLVGQLPPGQRFLPLQALAAQASFYFVLGHLGVQAQLAMRIAAAASGLPPHERDQLQALMRSPQRSLQMGFFEHGAL